MDLTYEEPTYEDDCELLELCSKLGATYNICYKGALLCIDRCDPALKQTLLQHEDQKQFQLKLQEERQNQLQHEEEVQLLRDKKAVRLSWVQLFIAAVFGGVCSKLIDLIPTIIDWIVSLLK